LEACPPQLLSHFADFLLSEYDPPQIHRALRSATALAGSDGPSREVSEWQRAEWLRCRDDPAHFIRTYCQIEIDHGGSLRWGPFDLWPDQADALGHFKANRRVCALKARQQGFSWLADADALHEMTFKPIASVLIFSKTDREAMKMLGHRLIGMWQRLPDWLRPAVARRPSSHELEFANGSRAMAMPCNAGQSYTGTLAIIDEADKMERATALDTLLAAVKPTVDAGGRLLLISTAEKSRPTSLFKKIFRAGDAGGYKCLFYPWSMRPTRTREWYDREKAESLATKGSLDMLYQEYPETADEALAPNELSARLPPDWVRQCFEPLEPLRFVPGQTPPGLILHGLASEAPFIPGLLVYRVPIPGRRYVLGVDPSEGQPGSHESPIVALDRMTGEQAAIYPGPAPMHVLGEYIVKLAAWYNGAGVLIERNNHGHAVLLWLASHGQGTYILLGPDGRPGWLEGQQQKMLLYDLAAKKLRERECVIHDPETRAQLASIEANTLKAPEGLPDDRSMGFVIALMATECVPKGRFEIL
jgi:hypothetical protein